MQRPYFAELAGRCTEDEPILEHQRVRGAGDETGLLAQNASAKIRLTIGAALVRHRTAVGASVTQRANGDVGLGEQAEAGTFRRDLFYGPVSHQAVDRRDGVGFDALRVRAAGHEKPQGNERCQRRPRGLPEAARMCRLWKE